MVLGCLLLGGGCVSLDPTEDIAYASSLVSERGNIETGWDAPWSERADEWDGESPLSSDAAVRTALQNNRAIRRRVEQIAAVRADLVQAHLLPNPVINIMLGFPDDGLGGQPMAAALVQQLAWLWRRPAAIDASEAALQSEVLAVSDAALRLVAEVRTAHARVHFAERAVAWSNENIELLQRSTDLMQRRFEVGEASRLDVNRAELELRAAEVVRADRTAELESAKRRMMDLLGRADERVEWRADDTPPAMRQDLESLDEARVMELASTMRLDVAAANASAEAHVARVHLQERGRLPDLDVGVGYQENFSDRTGVFPSVQVTPKLFDNNSARIARAASEFRQARIEADRARQQAVTEARQAWVNLCAQQHVVEAYESGILSLAQHNDRLARAAFDAGETDLTVLLEAQRRLNEARIELTDRQFAAARLFLELERAAGGSLQADLRAVEMTAHEQDREFTKTTGGDS